MRDDRPSDATRRDRDRAAVGPPRSRFTALQSAGGRFAPFSLAGALLAWLLFGLVHVLLRPYGPGELSQADGLSMIAAQAWSVAYQITQPPLFDWTLRLVQQVLGPTALSVYATKYAFMTAAGGFIYAGTRAAVREPRVAWMASIAPMLLFNVGFTIHNLSTHSVALIAALAATYFFFMKIAERAAWRDYAGLGLAVAAGTLSKYGFIVFPTAWALAFAVSPRLRTRILSPRFAFAALLAAAVMAPWVLWLAANAADLAASVDSTLIVHDDRSHAARAALGLFRLLSSVALYAVPVVPLLWLLYPALLRRGAGVFSGARRGVLRDVVGVSIVIGLVLAALLIVALGVDTMRARYAHVLALLLPVYIVMHLRPDEISGRPLMLFVTIAAVTQTASSALPPVSALFPVAPLCTRCDIGKPIDELALRLRAHGLDRAIIWVGGDVDLGGNLRRFLPDARIRTHRLLWPDLAPGDAPPCIALVEVREAGGRKGLPAAPDDPAGKERITAAWAKAYAGAERSSTWIVERLAGSDARCRRGA